MPVQDLPNGFIINTRAQDIDRYQRDYKLRTGGGDVGEGSVAFIDSALVTDAVAPVNANARSIALNANVLDMTEAGLENEAASLGLPRRLQESKSTGFVKISASIGGGFIPANRELREKTTRLRFSCARAGTYQDGQSVPVVSTDTGPQTNLPAGAVLEWTSPPAGIGPAATVLVNSDGDGLTGGRLQESVDELRLRVIDARANPAAAGNDADISAKVKLGGNTLGIPVQEVFLYSGMKGPGSTAYCFTLRPATPGGSRAPSSVERALIEGFIRGEFPHDDSRFPCAILEVSVSVKLLITWSKASGGWVDATPWPFLMADDWYVSTATSATTFGVKAAVTATTLPQIGQTIAFYDARNSVFVFKRIGSVTGPVSGEYTITCDVSNGASDIQYAPSLNERFCPYSASLDGIIAPIVGEFDLLGPGEQTEDFVDPELRMTRVPVSPEKWPSILRHKMVDSVDVLDSINDVQWGSPSLPFATPVGTPGVSSNQLTLGSILAFPS